METATAVAEAIAELEREFGQLQAEPAGDGGVYVTIAGLKIGPRWEPAIIDVSFLVPFNFPFNYIYPFYTNAVLTRVDGNALPSALQRVIWRERDVTQISLRPNRWQ